MECAAYGAMIPQGGAGLLGARCWRQDAGGDATAGSACGGDVTAGAECGGSCKRESNCWVAMWRGSACALYGLKDDPLLFSP